MTRGRQHAMFLRTLEQLDSEVPLQRDDVGRHLLRRMPQASGGTREAPLLGDSDEALEVSQIHTTNLWALGPARDGAVHSQAGR